MNAPQFLDFSKFDKKFAVYEDSSGELTLVTFNEDGRPDFIGEGYEQTHGALLGRLYDISELGRDEHSSWKDEDSIISEDMGRSDLHVSDRDVMGVLRQEYDYMEQSANAGEINLVADNTGIHRRPRATDELFFAAYDIKNFIAQTPFNEGIKHITDGQFFGTSKITGNERFYSKAAARYRLDDTHMALSYTTDIDNTMEFFTVYGHYMEPVMLDLEGKDAARYFPDLPPREFPEVILDSRLHERLNPFERDKILPALGYELCRREHIYRINEKEGITTQTKYKKPGGHSLIVSATYPYDSRIHQIINNRDVLSRYFSERTPEHTFYSNTYRQTEYRFDENNSWDKDITHERQVKEHEER